MVVNVSKTKCTVFHGRGKLIPVDTAHILHDGNDLGKNTSSLVSEIVRYHAYHTDTDCKD